MNRAASRILALLLLIGLAANWRLLLWIFRIDEPLGLLVGVTWLALAVAAIVGLNEGKRWGAYSLLLLAPFSTLMLSTPLFPGMHMVGLRGPIALSMWNLAALVSGVLVLRTSSAQVAS